MTRSLESPSLTLQLDDFLMGDEEALGQIWLLVSAEESHFRDIRPAIVLFVSGTVGELATEGTHPEIRAGGDAGGGGEGGGDIGEQVLVSPSNNTDISSALS